ncbi:MAG: redoxin domain-containing protein [Vicinamibacteraceae bacterium]
MRRQSLSVVFALLAVPVLFAAATGRSAEQRGVAKPPVDLEGVGPHVGERVPDFKLVDQTGEVRTLKSVLGPKGALLVFFRSADWCPYCKTQLVELQSRVKELEQEGLGVAAISYDSREVLADFAERRTITVPLLSDPGSKTIKTYGLLNTTLDASDDHYGIAFPGTFVLGATGEVTERIFEERFEDRHTVSSILVERGGTPSRPVTTASTEHLDVETWASDAILVPGRHVSLVLDIRPKAKMHVYAPGAEGYRVITLTLTEPPGVTTKPASYPPSAIYYFAPLDEHVPVYSEPFRLTQEIAVGASKEVQATLAKRKTLTINGQLDYQACDDKLCYRPASIPVSWSFTVAPLERK